MSNKNFDNLAGNLTESEKKALLNQISENLTSNPLEEDEKYATFKEKESKDYKIKSLKKDIEELGFIQKVVLNIRGFVMGKDIVEVHNNDLLQNIERRITYTAPTLVAIKKRRYTSLIISDFLKIYTLASPFIPHFTNIWESPLALERLITTILASKYNSVKTELYDFILESEIDKFIASGDNFDTVRKHLMRAVYDYKKKIPEFIFPEVEEELLSLISLKNIVLYNYTPMFKLMGISEDDSPAGIASKTVSMSLLVKHLEEFYKLLIQFSGTTLQQSSIEGLLKLTTENTDEDEFELWEGYNKLSQKLKSITVSYPFEDLIRFSRNNPYYKVDFSISKINIDEFYFSALKKELGSELIRIYKLREHSVVDVMLNKIFSNFELVKFANYTIHKDFDYKKLGLKYFKYTNTINILFNYLKHYYLREYKDILFVLNKQILEKNHMLQNRSLEISIGIETLIERILRLDKSLAPENEAGKTMRTLFTSVATNRQNLRMYKAFIKQKDDEVVELLRLGSKLLSEFNKVLAQTIKSPADSVRLQISAIHPTISRKHTVKDVLTEKIKDNKFFLDIFDKKIIFDSE